MDPKQSLCTKGKTRGWQECSTLEGVRKTRKREGAKGFRRENGQGWMRVIQCKVGEQGKEKIHAIRGKRKWFSKKTNGKTIT